MLTIVLAVWLWVSVGRSDASRSTLRAPLPRWLRWLGVVALAAVIVQGLLGGLTVRFFLPPAVSIAHAGLAQAFFCLTIAIAIFTSRWWQAAAPVAEPSLAKTLRASAVATTAAIYMQLLLGASIRHANLGVIPHIGVAVIVTLLVIRLTIGVVRAGLPSLRWPACGLLLLLIAQVGLGVAALLVRAPKDAMGQLETPQILLPTLHMVTGALMLGVGFALTVCSHRLAGETRNAAVAVGGEAPAC
jgi:cytochrome c oxidase assembly protein subunit 15